MRKRLSILIPLVLMMVSIVSSLLVFLQQDRESRNRIEQEMLREIGLEMGQLQNILYNRLTEGDENEALMNLLLVAMRPGIRTLMLTDDRHRVIMANRFRWKGEAAAEHSLYRLSDAQAVAQAGKSMMRFNAQQASLLQGYFPLVVSYRQGGLEKRMGLLYVEADIGTHIENARHAALEQSLIFGAIILLSAMMIAYILHRLVSRRVRVLLDAATRLAQGDFSVRTSLQGEDELSELGRKFDSMAAQIGENIQLREEAVNSRKHLLDTTIDGYWMLDNEGCLLDVNEAYCRMSGYSRDELLTMCIPQLEVNEQTPEEVAAHLKLVFERGWDIFETRHRHKDGSAIDVEVSSAYWKEEDRFFVFVRDIKERIAAREELERERQLLEDAQDVGHFGSWELDIVSNKLKWSDQIFRIFEIDQRRFGASYEAFLDAIHPDDRARVNQAYSESLADRKPYRITHRLLMPDGRIKWVEERCSTVFDETGKPLRSVGTVQDVTEHEALAEQGRIASVAFETQEAIIVTDRHANIIKVNHSFESTTGYSQAEVLGKNPRILASGRHDKHFYRDMWDSVLNEGRWSGEVWDRRKSGEVYPKWLTITAVKHMDEVTHFVAVFVDITERKKAEEEIRNLAFYDPLTSLPNRRLLQDHLQHALSQSARSDQFGALMFIDLDHFKVLNDTKGHEYGDKMLVEVARRLVTCVRDTDTISRFGGDEFVVLLEGMNVFKEEAIAQSGRIAEKIREVLSQPYELSGVMHQSSPSIGVVLFRGHEVGSEELLKQADLAMYQSKENGRNRVSFFETSMQALLESRTLLEGALRQALPKGELEMYYQLQTDESHALLGAEVLLRWRSAELGMVSPAQFIPMAEQTKLILPIGHWVLECACRQLKQWESHPLLGRMHLAVNISPVQFHQPDFVREVKTILQETGADPRNLELELTENLVLEDIDEATRKMTALKEVGVRFSMDDFGTGYSSLQYIKRLPIDLLKIDQSFVRDILTDPGDAMMVQTISGMAQNFGFGVIAEGVEDRAQIPPLVERGCAKFQGYLFSRPVPLAEFESLVENWQPD
ncbi:MAG: EAL domain-containing protein [Sideroxydans sp.]|nr:EAL domain-containing protein [Sideroxydans sp.]